MIEPKIYKDIYGTDELEVVMGETQVIIPMQETQCPRSFVFRLANGEIVVGSDKSDPNHPQGGYSFRASSWRRSKDGGKTWQETPSWASYFTHQFPNGEIIQLPSWWCRMVSDDNETYSFSLFNSSDNGFTWKETKSLLFNIPELAHIPTRCPHEENMRYAQMSDRIVSFNDGSLLASMLAKFKTDIKERTLIVQSFDRGKKWTYLSTVTFDLSKNGDRVCGFTEPDLLALPNGDILCFMRSGSRKGGALYMSRSRDGGKTWSYADPIADRSTYPTACLMENGVIVVVYGRPGDWLTFSLDWGETWINHFCFNKTPEPYDCGNYDWLEEIAPDILLVVYGRTDPNNYMLSEIVGTCFTVRPRKKT